MLSKYQVSRKCMLFLPPRPMSNTAFIAVHDAQVLFILIIYLKFCLHNSQISYKENDRKGLIRQPRFQGVLYFQGDAILKAD